MRNLDDWLEFFDADLRDTSQEFVDLNAIWRNRTSFKPPAAKTGNETVRHRRVFYSTAAGLSDFGPSEPAAVLGPSFSSPAFSALPHRPMH